MQAKWLIGSFLVAALGLLAGPGLCPAQQKLGPPGPPPSAPPVPVDIGAGAPNGPPAPVAAGPLGPPPPAPVLPPDGPPCGCLPSWAGWYVGADVAVLWPSIDLHFTGDGRLDLSANASPRVWIGYQFQNGSSVRVAYRNLNSTGNFLFQLPDEGGVQALNVKLDANWVDLDYVSPDYVLFGDGRLAWELGGGFASRDINAQAGDFSGVFSVDTHYLGGGPHAGLDTAWLFGDTGWALFGRLDGAVTFGEDRSRPGLQVAGPFGVDLSGPSHHRAEVEADLVVQAGLSWTKSYGRSWLHVAGGVQAEGWGLRREDPPLFPAHNVGAVGPFLGLEYGY